MEYLPDFCIVDTETTGTNALHDRIIEIGIVRVKKGKIIDKFDTLVNPHTSVHPKITEITGIYPEQLIQAPDFSEIKTKIKELLENTYFVAHNARFDYAFLKNEFKRHDDNITLKTICTIKLARKLFPEFRRYNLDTIIEKFSITCSNRHRALDDALAVFEFLNKAHDLIPKEMIKDVWENTSKKPSLPRKLSESDLENLPEEPGVYIFWANNIALYIGKSVNIKQRVKSHFTSDYSTPKDLKISSQIEHIETIRTAGELGALLKESELIKKLSPLYNRALRRNKSPITLIKNKRDDLFTIDIVKNGEQIKDFEQIMGICRSVREAKDLLYQLADKHHLCPKMLGLENGTGRCFYSQIGKCKGVCVGKGNPLSYNIRLIEAFGKYQIKKWPFDSTVLIKEESFDQSEIHFVNNWRYLGSIDHNGEVVRKNSIQKFDYDMYKILKRFILKRRSSLQISSATNDQLRQINLYYNKIINYPHLFLHLSPLCLSKHQTRLKHQLFHLANLAPGSPNHCPAHSTLLEPQQKRFDMQILDRLLSLKLRQLLLDS